jgi:single-strand DNA-binding protein
MPLLCLWSTVRAGRGSVSTPHGRCLELGRGVGHGVGMETDEWVNEVRLVGKVSGAVDERELPSGDFMAALRLVVPRQPGQRRGTATVDTIDVACWTGRTRRSARRLATGDQVEVVGALRRRFFRAGAATASRYEVEAHRLARVRRLPQP